MAFPNQVRLFEVGPRDGLQNEPGEPIDTAIKVAFIDRLAAAGLQHIEAGSFVSPKWVPQMADSGAVFDAIPRREGVTYAALTPNRKGLDGALSHHADEVAVFAAASEAFSQKNINCSISESLKRFEPVLEAALEAGVRVRGYVSTVLGCPYQGAVSPRAVADVAAALHAMGCYEISLGDTIGVGTPLAAKRMLESVAQRVPVEVLAAHFHDSYGQALVNLYAVLEEGVAVVDASTAGLGGCPYAQGASGNVATEDVLYMLNGMDIKTGVELSCVVETAYWIADQLGRRPQSRVALAQRPAAASA
jgi:hydroxymethylglutaryl-CoA lyase